jgi:ribosome-interacting GTPase 1
MPLNLEDAENIKKVIVDPVVEALRAEMAPLRKEIEEHEWKIKGQYARIVKLEGNQKKALLGYAGIVALVSMGFNAALAWGRRKLGI